MHTELENLSRNLYSLRSELLEPVIGINSAYKLLITKAPETANEALNHIGSISENILSEIHPFPYRAIDLQSPDNAVNQLSSLANKWEKDIEKLSLQVKNVQNMESQFEDAHKVLVKIIYNKLEKFQGYIHFMKLIKTKHLTQDDGFAEILNIDNPK